MRYGIYEFFQRILILFLEQLFSDMFCPDRWIFFRKPVSIGKNKRFREELIELRNIKIDVILQNELSHFFQLPRVGNDERKPLFIEIHKLGETFSERRSKISEFTVAV